MSNVPPVSVVMPVRNAAPYLDESIASILGQSFTDFEFVIRDDGSTDGSQDIVRRWASRDRRIRAFEGDRLGLVEIANWVVHEARAPIVARMDADDIAHPGRLARQVGLLDRAETVVLAGSLYETIDSRGARILPVARWRLGRKSCYVPFPHASATFRKQAFLDVGGYRPDCIYWEDLDLFLRMGERGRIAVVAEPLLAYRISGAGVRRVSQAIAFERAIEKSLRCLALYRAGRSYDHLLPGAGVPAKVDPYVFVARGSASLWDKAPVRELEGLRKRAALGFNWVSLQCLVWAVWARVHPPSLRALLRGMHRWRNASASHVEAGRVYEWRPGQGPLALRAASDQEERAPSRAPAPPEPELRVEPAAAIPAAAEI
ncbi:MAG TPA: glycosyltransferase family A protein [Allosphingosinicella sp.]|nr:glycosyltransferase family A protein [Allosphingosinicella sp.]